LGFAFCCADKLITRAHAAKRARSLRLLAAKLDGVVWVGRYARDIAQWGRALFSIEGIILK
jgi:hypothetical protein